MNPESKVAKLIRAVLAIGMLSAASGCVNLHPSAPLPKSEAAAQPTKLTSVSREGQALERELAALDGRVREEEAARVASCAYETSKQLAVTYRVIRPALFHNFLVNVGLKSRGLCYQWAEDLLAQLQGLSLATLELHWGIARGGTWREHNSIVVTARGQPFAEGIVLDAWRDSGHLVWVHVSADRYPWEEGVLNLEPPAPRAAVTGPATGP